MTQLKYMIRWTFVPCGDEELHEVLFHFDSEIAARLRFDTLLAQTRVDDDEDVEMFEVSPSGNSYVCIMDANRAQRPAASWRLA